MQPIFKPITSRLLLIQYRLNQRSENRKQCKSTNHSDIIANMLFAFALFATSLPQQTKPISEAPQLTIAPIELKPYAQVTFEVIDEMSGIVKSRKLKDTYWVHNDSGDSARLFAIRRNGTVITTNTKQTYNGITISNATNVDWEDIAIEGDTLYISETGNNLNMRKDLCVYAVKEPNPATTTESKFLRRIPISYPDQTEFPPAKLWNFDCESLAVYKKKLYFVTKWRVSPREPGNGAALYVLDKERTDGESNVLRKLDTNANLGGWATAAEISPDGKKLAILIQAPKAGVWIFDMTKGEKVLSHPLGYVGITKTKQCEAICWDSPTKLILSNEQRDLFELTVPTNYPSK